MHGFESAPGRNRAPGYQQAELDRADLARFGYSQELFRTLGAASSFGLSFSVLAAFAGIAILFGFGVRLSGPLGLTLGWPVISVLTLAAAASLGELCSAYPTAGGNYQWASALGGTGWGWFAAFFNLTGLVVAIAALSQAAVQFAVGILGVAPATRSVVLLSLVILVTQALANHFGIRPAAVINNIGVVAQVLGALVVVGFLLSASRQPVNTLFHRPAASPYVWAFLPGLVVAQWSMLGFEAPAHLGEETLNPRRNAPWVMILSVAATAVIGYAVLLALVLAGPDGSAPETVAAALGPGAAGAFAVIAIATMWYCGLACVASASRTLYALARDRGTPLPGLMQPVSRRFGTPFVAIWLIALAAALVSIWRPGLPVLFALSAVTLQVACLIPIATAYLARTRGSSWPADARWSLGRYGAPVNIVAIIYLTVASITILLPPNHPAAAAFVGLIAVLAALYFLEARRKFAGPAWTRSTHRLPAGPRK